MSDKEDIPIVDWLESRPNAQQIRALQARVAELEAALREATEGMMDMRAYVPGHFAEKWDHDGYINRAVACLRSRPLSTSQADGSGKTGS